MNDGTDPTEQVSFRLHREVVARIDALAAHCGHTRSQWLRAAINLTDATQTLAELKRLEESGPLPPKTATVKTDTEQRLGEVGRALAPKPLPLETT